MKINQKNTLLDIFLLWWFCSYSTITFFFKFLYKKSWPQIANEFFTSLFRFFPNRLALYITFTLAITFIIVYFPYKFLKYEIKSTTIASKYWLEKNIYLQPLYSDYIIWKSKNTNLSIVIRNLTKIRQNLTSVVLKNLKIMFFTLIEVALIITILHERFNQGFICTMALLIFPIITAYLLKKYLPIIIGFDKKKATLSPNVIIRLIGLISFGSTFLQLVK